jgi:hypothetical protein
MHAGARLKNDPDASPNTQLKMYSPGRVWPKGSQMVKIARAPRQMSAVCVLMRPYLSAMTPVMRRPTVEKLEQILV